MAVIATVSSPTYGVDPAQVTCAIERSDGIITLYTYGRDDALTRNGLGVYVLTLTVTDTGWTYWWAATGQAGSGGTISVPASYYLLLSTDRPVLVFAGADPILTTQPVATPPYQAAILADNPLVFLRFNEPSGTVATNLGSTGSANNGTYNSGSLNGASALGLTDASVTLSGIIGSNVAVPAPVGLGTSAAFSLEMIVKVTNYKESGSSLEYLYGGSNGHGLLFVPEVNGGTNLKSFAFNGNAAFASSLFSSSSFPSTTPTWHHVVYTYDGGGVAAGTECLYVDSGLAATRTGTSGTHLPYTPNLNTTAAVGELRGNASFPSNLQGSVDELAIFSGALTMSQVKNHYLAANLQVSPVNASDQYPAVTSTVGLALIDDASAFVTADYAGVSYVYAENKTPPLPTGVFGDHYWPWSQSYYGTGGNPYDLTWLKANHPDWLLYIASTQIDANLAWYFGSATGHPPTIDMTNTTVQQWVVDTLWRPQLAAGWKGIAIDDNPSINVFGNQSTDGSCALGHFTGTGGTWVPLGYTGHWMDTNWATAQRQALVAMIDYLHTSAGTGVAYPTAPVMVNNGFNNNLAYHVDGGATDAVIYDQFNYIPELAGLMCEGCLNDGSGPGSRLTSAAHGVLSNPWLYEVSAHELKARTGMFVFLGKAPYSVTANMTDTNTLQASGTSPRDDLNWSLANYCLIKGPRSYFYWAGSNQYTQKIGQLTQMEYTLAATIGAPTETYHAVSGTTAFMRTFTSGVAYVNPDPSNSATITLPAGSWRDLRGTSQGATVTLAATTGAVFVH